MRAIPEGFNQDKLIGRQLNQICIGSFDLQFRFDSEHIISVYGKVVIEIASESTTIMPGEDWGAPIFLTRVVGKNVVGWRIEGSHEFSVTLTEDCKLFFFSEDSQYEDILIRPGLFAF